MGARRRPAEAVAEARRAGAGPAGREEARLPLPHGGGMPFAFAPSSRAVEPLALAQAVGPFALVVCGRAWHVAAGGSASHAGRRGTGQMSPRRRQPGSPAFQWRRQPCFNRGARGPPGRPAASTSILEAETRLPSFSLGIFQIKLYPRLDGDPSEAIPNRRHAAFQ